jgi:hypothetical protein
VLATRRFDERPGVRGKCRPPDRQQRQFHFGQQFIGS